jgi:2-oxoisovalerate dehydrogenase E2 component (dihydrolipoyl transacylase)
LNIFLGSISGALRGQVSSDGAFRPRRMMNLSSSFDHRVIDGHDAAQFIQRIKSNIEDPLPMLV